jgi:ubiquinone/menaquinone biosynthesis C-methylase UbiE
MDNAYLEAQRRFWNVSDLETAKFDRVDTRTRLEEEYERLADEDFAFVFAPVTVTPAWTVLEIGCGVGRLLSRLVQRTPPARAIGVDISENMIGYASHALRGFPNVKLAVNSGADLAMVEDASVDFAYAAHVFIHIHSVSVVSAYFAEMRRVLRPGGVFRFNIRRMDLSSMFSNSSGGLAAKVGYAAGMLSPISGRLRPRPGFDGIHYRKRDVHRLARGARLAVKDLVLHDRGSERNYWCTVTRPLHGV